MDIIFVIVPHNPVYFKNISFLYATMCPLSKECRCWRNFADMQVSARPTTTFLLYFYCRSPSTPVTRQNILFEFLCKWFSYLYITFTLRFYELVCESARTHRNDLHKYTTLTLQECMNRLWKSFMNENWIHGNKIIMDLNFVNCRSKEHLPGSCPMIPEVGQWLLPLPLCNFTCISFTMSYY